MTERAFEIANSIRYLDDVKSKKNLQGKEKIQHLDLSYSMRALRVSEPITPSIYTALSNTCQRLDFDIKKVIMYVTPSADIQAQCISYDTDVCLITVSSELVKLLTQEELTFVIGHELGHFLLFHNIETIITSKESLIRNRAREISVDRVGLIACRNIDVALKAILKTLSGLGDSFINLDINTFINQIEQSSDILSNYHKEASHPSLVLRAKALLRFSFSNVYHEINDKKEGKCLNIIDLEIKNDLDQYGDRQIRDEIDNLRGFLVLWVITYSMVFSVGSFTKDYQNLIVTKFNEEMRTKLVDILSGYDDNDTRKAFVKKKLIDAYKQYSLAAPNETKKKLNTIINEISEETGNLNLPKEIQMLI